MWGMVLFSFFRRGEGAKPKGWCRVWGGLSFAWEAPVSLFFGDQNARAATARRVGGGDQARLRLVILGMRLGRKWVSDLDRFAWLAEAAIFSATVSAERHQRPEW